MHTLLSFLGKSRADYKNGYRTAKYNFNGTHKETAYFGLALTKTMHPDKRYRPKKCVFLQES